MPDFILVEGDKANFLPSFGAAIVVVQPGDLKGSGPATFNGKKICVDGDEKKVSVPGCTYMTPQYSNSWHGDAQNLGPGRRPEGEEDENGRQKGAAQRQHVYRQV